MSMQDKPGIGWNLTVVVPLGLSAIGAAHALGLSCAATLFVRSSGKPNKNDGYSEKERDIGQLAQVWLVPLLALVVGEISRHFMQ